MFVFSLQYPRVSVRVARRGRSCIGNVLGLAYSPLSLRPSFCPFPALKVVRKGYTRAIEISQAALQR